MNTLKQAAQKALYALEDLRDCWNQETGFSREAITALREALAGDNMSPTEQAQQEPVSWIYEDELPKGYPYDEMFSRSKIIEGVRMFPEVQTEQSTVKESLTAQDHIRDATKMVAEQAEQDHFAASGKPIAEHEPVGYFAYDEEHDIWEELTGPNAPGATPLYAAPVRTKDLTEEDINELWNTALMIADPTAGNLRFKFARAVIAAYKEKNK